MDDITKEVSCLDCVNALFHCYGAWHQFDRYYKDSKFDDCVRQRNELQLCWKLKMSGPEEQKKLLREVLRTESNPTEGVIWQPKRPAAAAAPSAS